MTQQLEADELKLMAYANFGVGIKGSDTPSTPKPQLKTGQALPFWKASKLNGKSKPWKRAPRFPWGKRFTIQREIIQNTINWSEVPGPAIRLHPLVWKWGLSLHCTSDYKADESKAGLETPFSIHQRKLWRFKFANQNSSIRGQTICHGSLSKGLRRAWTRIGFMSRCPCWTWFALWIPNKKQDTTRPNTSGL